MPPEPIVKWRRISLRLAGVAGVVFVLAVLFIGVDLWWEVRQWYHPPLLSQLPSSNPDQLLKEKLDAYERHAGEVQQMIAVLLGVNTLVAAGLAAFSYLNARASVEEARRSAGQVKDSAERAEKLVEETRGRLDNLIADLRKQADQTASNIRRIFPIVADIDGSLRQVVNQLTRFFPIVDWTEGFYQALKPQEKQTILYFEKAVAAFEFFDLHEFRREISQIYRGLGTYYGTKYKWEKKESEASKRANTAAPANTEDLERARFYLERAVRTDGENTAALNDRAILAFDVEDPPDPRTAIELFTRSRQIDPGQQRPLYNLALQVHRKGDYQTSIDLLTEALNLDRWQEIRSADRAADILYNRACSFCSLAAADPAAATEGLLKQACDDLSNPKVKTALSGASKLLAEAFRGDIQKNKELYPLWGYRRGDAVLRELVLLVRNSGIHCEVPLPETI